MSSTHPSCRWRSAIHLFSGDSRCEHLQARMHIISKHWTAGYIDTTPGRNWVLPMGSLLYIADKNVRTMFSWELYGGCTLTLAESNCWSQELILDSSHVLFITQHVLSLRRYTHFIIVIRKFKKMNRFKCSQYFNTTVIIVLFFSVAQIICLTTARGSFLINSSYWYNDKVDFLIQTNKT